jgi:hypothetical protein
MYKLQIVNHETDHILVAADVPMRFEVSLIPSNDGDRVILHGYTGAETDPEQEPDLVYDGTLSELMKDRVVA